MTKRKNKMSTGEAVKILAFESKQAKEEIINLKSVIHTLRLQLMDYMALFERYIQHTEDGDEFIKKMTKLVEEKANEQKANEQADGQDTNGDKQDKGIRSEGVRAQEG